MDNRELKQGTPEWHEARLGKITGTGFSKVLAKKGSKTRDKYLEELAIERRTGVSTEVTVNEDMRHGTETEPKARAYYEKETKCIVKQVGFIDFAPTTQVELMEFSGRVGVSPDGLVGDDGVIEIKCPKTSTHYKNIKKLPSQYVAQVQGILWVTGRQWCDFVSFDDRDVPKMKIPCWRVRVERDEEYIANLKVAVSSFIDELIIKEKDIEEVDPRLLLDVAKEFGGCTEEEWHQKHIDSIRGKCLFGHVNAQIAAGKTPKQILKPANKADLLALYKFEMTGE